jgi:hypothetical protein
MGGLRRRVWGVVELEGISALLGRGWCGSWLATRLGSAWWDVVEVGVGVWRWAIARAFFFERVSGAFGGGGEEAVCEVVVYCHMGFAGLPECAEGCECRGDCGEDGECEDDPRVGFGKAGEL